MMKGLMRNPCKVWSDHKEREKLTDLYVCDGIALKQC
jgi:hypothetical protein